MHDQRRRDRNDELRRVQDAEIDRKGHHRTHNQRGTWHHPRQVNWLKYDVEKKIFTSTSIAATIRSAADKPRRSRTNRYPLTPRRRPTSWWSCWWTVPVGSWPAKCWKSNWTKRAWPGRSRRAAARWRRWSDRGCWDWAPPWSPWCPSCWAAWPWWPPKLWWSANWPSSFLSSCSCSTSSREGWVFDKRSELYLKYHF